MLAFYLYAIIWRKIVYNLLKKTLLRNAAAESCDNMTGEEGVFRKIENREFVFWNVYIDSTARALQSNRTFWETNIRSEVGIAI